MVRGELDVRVLGQSELVAPQRQAAVGALGGVFQPQRSRCGVAGIHVRLLARGLLLDVQGGERRPAHVGLSTDLDHSRDVRPVEAVWQVTDAPRCVRDVLSGLAVASCGCSNQPAVFVADRHGDPVELGLHGEGPRRCVEPLEGPAVPGVEVLQAERVVEREHRRVVSYRSEGLVGGGADRAGG